MLSLAWMVMSCAYAPRPLAPGDRYAPPIEEHVEGRRLMREGIALARPAPGFVLPYALQRVYGTFGDCRPGGRQHRGLDLGGVGPNAGLGTPVRAMVRSRILFIGRPEDDPARFGTPDLRAGTVERGGRRLPRTGVHPLYGRVAYFTRDYGAWRSGAIVVTEVIGTPLAGHRVRYMHLAAIHPMLDVGDEVEAGQEIGLMGGTAVQFDLPHVHIDIETPDGVRVDPAPWLGMEADDRVCR